MKQTELGIIPVREGEFWTAKQRDGHSLHEISYRACYKPQLPEFFIKKYTKRGDVVYDPFMGRGTTLLEAALHGRRALGNDINPLSQILLSPRLARQDLESIASRLDAIELSATTIEDEELLVFFEDRTLQELYSWRTYFRTRREAGLFDKLDAWIQMTACNRLTGHSNGFFSVYTLPPNQATSLTAQRKINAKRDQVPTYRDTKALILKKSKSLLRHDYPKLFGGKGHRLIRNSADLTSEIAGESVQLIVTSPPFLDVVDYVGDNWLRNWFCEVSVDKSELWQLPKLEAWTLKMEATLIELNRILKPGGCIAFEVGEVKKGAVKLEENIAQLGKSVGLLIDYILINTQNFTKTANCWGVDNNTKGTNSNRIVVFRKQ